jgi:phage terminase large subunit
MIGVTTALRKIAGMKGRIRAIQGGQGASKTFSILMLLINHARSVPNREIFVASSELSKMRITVIKDFVKIMVAFGVFNRSEWVDGTLYRFGNGSFIRFIGLDKEDIGKGLRCDVMFVNEANKVKFDTYRELTSRAKKIFIDFNPNAKFWFHTEVLTRPDCSFIKLTYRDNEYLSTEERSEILGYREKGYALNKEGEHILNADGTPIVTNQYWANMWRVYGLGEIGQVEGRIYTWKKIPYNEYLAISTQTYTGNDWGKVDPWGVVDLKYHDGRLFLHELNYASENEIERGMSEVQKRAIRSGDDEQYEGLIGWKFTQMGVPKDRLIVCDNNRPNKIISLRRAGWEYAVAVGGKTGLLDRISILNGLDVYYTDISPNLEMEQENYCYSKDRFGTIQEMPEDANNHLIDAAAYGVQKMFTDGIIRVA